jgi:hypothetical protein
MVFHPILPPYLICDFIREFEKSHDHVFIKYAETILALALKHAVKLDGVLVFKYEPGSGLSAIPHSFYSALTQAWYVKAICELSRHVGDRYREQFDGIFRSLQLPAEHSGVLIKKDYGWIVEEYPTTPPLYTLNGWLTVLRMIVACRKDLDRARIDYKEFLDRNLDAVEHLLHLYDAKFCVNSRYQLAGFTRVRIVFDRPASHRLESFQVAIPGDGVFKGNLSKTTNYRWENFVERNEQKLLQFNVVLSLVSYPKPNVFSAVVMVDRDCHAKVFLADGDYRPDLSAMPTERWIQISTVALSGNKQNDLSVEIPFDGKSLFAYPTNFKKRIGEKLFNAYHFVHIVDLAEIHGYSKRKVFKEFAMKWLDYCGQWGGMQSLSSEQYSLLPHKYGQGFRAHIERLLTD